MKTKRWHAKNRKNRQIGTISSFAAQSSDDQMIVRYLFINSLFFYLDAIKRHSNDDIDTRTLAGRCTKCGVSVVQSLWRHVCPKTERGRSAWKFSKIFPFARLPTQKLARKCRLRMYFRSVPAARVGLQVRGPIANTDTEFVLQTHAHIRISRAE